MNEYTETTVGQRLTLNWKNAVIDYTAKVVKYGWMLGASLAALAILWQGLPIGWASWLRALLLVITGGCLVAGFAGVVAIIIKDIFFPYRTPYEHLKHLPAAAAPATMQAQPLMAQDGNTWHYGKVKLEPEKLLALAQAILQGGETKVSQRKLAEWGVVAGKDSTEAKQLKADIMRLGYGLEAGNGELSITRAFVQYLSGVFPALAPTPPTPARSAVSKGGVASHHHQTPPGDNPQ